MADFLLSSKLARELYEGCAKDLPIVDYHNHLSAADIESDKRYTDIYELWLQPDPYKHRAMRMCGVPEFLITGNAPAKEKFRAWCSVFPKLIGNPLYVWSLMELRDIFEINDVPCEYNWEKIYVAANRFLLDNTVTPSFLFKRFNVEYACPCCDITDNIDFFKGSSLLAPSLRSDNILMPSPDWIEGLSGLSGTGADDFEGFQKALETRVAEFISAGCRFTDQAIDNGFIFFEDDGKNGRRFSDILSGRPLSESDRMRFQSYMLTFLGRICQEQGLVMQTHIGAQRFASSRLRKIAGPAGGFACIGNSVSVSSLTGFFDRLEQTAGGLPKCVIFSMNPSDYPLISVISGSFSKDGVPGLITQGPAWWWCDHKLGIRDALENMTAFSLLSNFTGMTTDSRSFLSFIRHDYFRRILCDWIAQKVIQKEFPESRDILMPLIYNLCYGNAKKILCGSESLKNDTEQISEAPCI